MDYLVKILIGILPKFIIDFYDKIILQKLLSKIPNSLMAEINLFLKFTFPTNTPIIKPKSCKFLSSTTKFFIEKNKALDSLRYDQIGCIKILCRLPWLLMDDLSREIHLDTEQSRSYFLRLQENAQEGKIRYLYNINSLSRNTFEDSIERGKVLKCYPALLTSVTFDVMIINTSAYRHKIIFATRPMGTEDQEIGVLVDMKDLFLTYDDYFDNLWDKSYRFWNENNKSLNEKLQEMIG